MQLLDWTQCRKACTHQRQYSSCGIFECRKRMVIAQHNHLLVTHPFTSLPICRRWSMTSGLEQTCGPCLYGCQVAAYSFEPARASSLAPVSLGCWLLPTSTSNLVLPCKPYAAMSSAPTQSTSQPSLSPVPAAAWLPVMAAHTAGLAQTVLAQ